MSNLNQIKSSLIVRSLSTGSRFLLKELKPTDDLNRKNSLSMSYIDTRSADSDVSGDNEGAEDDLDEKIRYYDGASQLEDSIQRLRLLLDEKRGEDGNGQGLDFLNFCLFGIFKEDTIYSETENAATIKPFFALYLGMAF